MKNNNQNGFIGAFLVTVGVLGFVWFLFWGVWCIRAEPSEQLVSGIVYNNTNNAWLSGNTDFSVRAAVDTYTSEENASTYCLPPNSPYAKLVSEAAQNKKIRVVVTTKKTFQIVAAPWVCVGNVTVKREE